MCKANHPTWKHQDNGRIKSRHRKNQGRRHRNRLQISGHTTKHAEQTKTGQTQSNNNLQKNVKADSQTTPQCQKQNTGHQHICNASGHLHSRNLRLEQERNTGSRQNDKEDNEHVRTTSPKSKHPQLENLPRKKGGRGLREVAATVRFQRAGLQEYISKTKEKDLLIEAVWKHQAIKGYKSKKEEMDEWETENTTKWTSKQLHGQYKRQVPEITSMEKAYGWM